MPTRHRCRRPPPRSRSAQQPSRLRPPAKYTHRELNIYSGPIETYTAHDEAYVCWNGTKAWQQDYRYCYVSAYPLGFGGSDSCVVINNNTSVITLRNAFWISTYALPTWKRYGWMSYTVNKNGAVSAVSGFCCN